MPLGTVLATVAAYIAIAVLLLSLNLASRWRWWIKGGAIVITGAFFVATYFAIGSIFGWPTDRRLPDRFSLLATEVIEPDKFLGTDGAIYLWVREMNENNVPVGAPRNYQLPYVEPLAEAANEAQAQLDAGETVEGALQEAAEGEDAAVDEAGQPLNGQRNGGGYEVDFMLQFNDMPIVALPDKGVL